ncbi:3042_t:CDS:2 [Racocetra fulgida]|uniref:3042_t:CDS:1 n=1 Tax=Racocetra fulgida TaxID=60492 RepID=A0A9N9CQI8_9GLOM|nr:3042_t:CDS:2 [Racocetra fulgida]
MLITDNAKFYIQLIPFYWYLNNTDMFEELFLKADKFYDEMLTEETTPLISYLCALSENNHNFLEESLTILQQKKIYKELHSTYKKVLNKALTSWSNSQRLIDMLKGFAENDDDKDIVRNVA